MMNYIVPYICDSTYKYLIQDITFNTKVEDILDNLKPKYTTLILNDLINDAHRINRIVLELKVRTKQPLTVVYWSDYSDSILEHLNLGLFKFIKIGSYKEEFGDLSNPNTNQAVYEIIHIPDNTLDLSNHYDLVIKDITRKYYKNVN